MGVGLNRHFWQYKSFTSNTKRASLLRVSILGELKLNQTVVSSWDTFETLISQKKLMQNIFNLKIQTNSLGFFKLKGQRSLLKKKLNTNLAFGFRCGNLNFNLQDDGVQELDRFLLKLLFWTKLTRHLRVQYRVHTGLLKKRVKKNTFELILVNPVYIKDYLQGSSVESSFLKKLIRVQIFTKDRGLLGHIAKKVS